MRNKKDISIYKTANDTGRASLESDLHRLTAITIYEIFCTVAYLMSQLGYPELAISIDDKNVTFEYLPIIRSDAKSDMLSIRSLYNIDRYEVSEIITSVILDLNDRLGISPIGL